MSARRRFRQDTTTYLVCRELERDDLLSVADLARRTGRSTSQCSAACCSLYAADAVDFLTIDGVTRLYFGTFQNDTRTRVVKERVPESAPRKPRAKKRRVRMYYDGTIPH